MPKQHLAENFVDDILSENMNGRRRYNLIQNSDGTVSLEDVTEYTQLGSDYGANQVNASNRAINESVDKANVIDNKEDLLANMTEGKVAGALATKKGFDELNSNLSNANNQISQLISGLSEAHSKIIRLESKQIQVSGSLSDWLILKYPNGYIEAHRRYQYTGIATTTSSGGQYVSGTLWSGSTPVISGVTWNGGHGMASYGSRSAGTYFYRLDQINDGAGAVRCIIACRISATNVNFPAHIVLTGTWR